MACYFSARIKKKTNLKANLVCSTGKDECRWWGGSSGRWSQRCFLPCRCWRKWLEVAPMHQLLWSVWQLYCRYAAGGDAGSPFRLLMMMSWALIKSPVEKRGWNRLPKSTDWLLVPCRKCQRLDQWSVLLEWTNPSSNKRKEKSMIIIRKY